MIVGGHDIQDGCIILEPRDVFDRGVVGYDTDENRLIYSYRLLIGAMCECWGLSWSDALDWIAYNTERSLAYMQNPPILKDDIGE